MERDTLFLLKPGFTMNGKGPFFCAACATVEGMLSFYPELRKRVDVQYVEYPRPRPKIVEAIGEEHQSAPVLVLGNESAVPKGVSPQTANGRRFLDNEYEICNYLAAVHHVPAPEGY